LKEDRLMRYVFAAAAVALIAYPAFADDDWFPPVSDATVEAECGACHLAFSPAMLPERSWHAIMSGLNDHFGEDASLDGATAAHIETYLVANAADADSRYEEVLRRLDPAAVPLRISELPWWIREHEEEVGPGAFDDPDVGSKANCVACHRDAARGSYEDD
jgi:hypothetical protein